MAAEDIYLHIEGIEGEVVETRHQGAIEVESFAWGETQTAPSGRGSAATARVAMQDLHLVMKASRATPKLFLACASGQRFERAVLTCRKAGRPLDFLKWVLTDVQITSFETHGSVNEFPLDQIAITFSTITCEYLEVRADGSPGAVTSAGWNLRQNCPT